MLHGSLRCDGLLEQDGRLPCPLASVPVYQSLLHCCFLLFVLLLYPFCHGRPRVYPHGVHQLCQLGILLTSLFQTLVYYIIHFLCMREREREVLYIPWSSSTALLSLNCPNIESHTFESDSALLILSANLLSTLSEASSTTACSTRKACSIYICTHTYIITLVPQVAVLFQLTCLLFLMSSSSCASWNCRFNLMWVSCALTSSSTARKAVDLLMSI